MTAEVKCCAEYSTFNTAAQMMWENDIVSFYEGANEYEK
jgi:hypothetical protein